MKRHVAAPLLATAVYAAFPSAGTAQTAISFGQTTAGSIAVPGEVDAYTFSAAANDRVIATMAVSSGELIANVELYDPGGALVCSDSGYTAELEDCQLGATGTFTLRARDWANLGTGTYGLHLQRLNNPATATALSFGQTLSGTIAAVSEKDAFRFSASANDRVIATMAVSSGGLIAKLQLYDPAGVLVCWDAGYPAEITDCQLGAAGAYTLLADDWDNTQTGAYGLHLQRLNNPAAATALSYGQTLAGTINVVTEKDAYTFSASANDRVIATMAVSSGGLVAELQLYDPAGVLLCSDFGFPAEIEGCQLAAAGTYTLLADDWDNTRTGAYGLHLQRLNNPAAATAVSYGQTLSGTIGAVTEKDAYTFSAGANDRVNATMVASSGGLVAKLRLYDAAGALLCSDFGFPAEIRDCTLGAAGTYTLLADDWDNLRTGSYGLHVQRLNNPAAATALSYGQTLSRTIDAVTEKDAYRFAASANDRVTAIMAASSGGLVPNLELYDPGGALLCSDLGYPAEIEDCQLGAAGTYTLLADDWDNFETGAYGLHLQRFKNPGNATPIAIGETKSGSIGLAAEMDAFTFDSVAGDTVRVRLTETSGSWTPDIRVYGPDGFQLCEAWHHFEAEIASCALTADGKATLLVFDRDRTATGGYTLRLEGCALTCAATVPLAGAIGQPVAFAAVVSASNCAGTPAYRWEFGDGASAPVQNPDHAYGAEGRYSWSLTVTAEDVTCTQGGTVTVLPPGTVLFDDFDTYPVGSELGGQGGWEWRWSYGITVSDEHFVSPPQSARMDNNNGCWESQLFHPLPDLDVIWFSADIMGVPTGRTGCHAYDASVRLFNPDEGGTWGSSPVRFALRSGPGESDLGPGLTVTTTEHQVSGVYGWQDHVSLEPDYDALVNHWIHVQAKVDSRRHRVDVWVGDEYRGSLAMDPTAPRYTGIALDVGEGLGFVDNVWVSEIGPEPGDNARELSIGVPLPTSIPRGRYRFFKVTSQPGRDLLVTVDQTGQPGRLELYGSVGGPPSRRFYDAHDSSQTGSVHQSLAFPATSEPRTYYFLVYYDGGPASVPFTILARHPGFHLDRVSPAAASNAGSTTVTLIGSELTPATRARLLAPAGGALLASDTRFVSSTRVHATFDLTGAAIGLHDVRIVDPAGGTSTLVDRFQVTAGNPGILRATLEAPASVRPDRNYTAWLEYGNRGGADLSVPLLVISSPQDVPMRLSGSEPFRRGPIQVLGINMDDPAGVLTPGAGFSIPVELHSSAAGNEIRLDVEVMVADATSVDWNAIELEVRPPGIADDAWNAIWSILRTRFGTTWTDYLTTLTAASAYLANHYREAPGALDPAQVPPPVRLPVPVYSVRDLFAFELAKASAALSPRPVLAVGLDAFYDAPGLPLTFLRLAPSPIAQRLRLGPLGRGWVHVYEYALRVAADGSVALQEPWGQERVFLRNAGGTFTPAAGGENAILESAGGGYVLREPDGLVRGFANDRLAYLEDANGNRLTLGYSSGALTSVSHSTGDRLDLEYDANGRIARIVDPAGRTTRYRYDGGGEHLAEVEEEGGPVTGYSYRPADASPAAHALSGVTFPDGGHRFFGYDGFGRLSGEWRDGGAERLTYAYDAQGTITVGDELGGVSTLDLGHRGQLLDVETSEGSRMALAYDEMGNVTRVSDASDAEAMLAYDARGNPLGSRDPAGGITRLTYGGPLDRLTSLLDARSNRTRFGYDALGNLDSIEYPDSSSETFAVDAEGDLVSYTNRSLQTITFERSASGQLVRKRYPNGSTVDYAYDLLGNLDAVTDAAGTIGFAYDDRGFLARIDYPGGHFFVVQHDGAGRRTSRSDETGFTLFYEYDAAGRLVRLRDTSGSEIIGYQYDKAGRLAREQRGNGTSTTYGYDSAGQLLHLVHRAPDGTVQSRFDYAYDERGNRTSMTTLPGVTSYEYDSLGQLVGVTYPGGGKATYEYDALGNRVAVTENGVTETYTANELNQYTEAGDATFEYDDDGNLISRTDASGTSTYEYDDESRLVRVTTPADGTWDYTYDALGNRVAVVHDGVVRRYVHDPIGLVDVVAEHDGSGNLVARYVHGLGLVARIDAAGKAAYYGFDALGHTRQLTNGTGAVVITYDYDPWGVSLNVDESVPNPFRYVGRFGLMETGHGLSLMRARYYRRDLGRFLTPDPIRFLGGDVNFYTYVANSPSTAIDPSGLSTCQVPGRTVNSAGDSDAVYVYYRIPVNPTSFPGLLMRFLGLTPSLVPHRGVGGPDWTGFGYGPGGVIAESFRFGYIRRRIPDLSWGELQKRMASEIRNWPGGANYGVLSGSKIDCWDYADYYTGDSRWFQAQNPSAALPLSSGSSTTVNIVRAIDPNEKTGPGPQVRPGERVTYTIYFENLPAATAPAQEVFIIDDLDADFDWSTFELGEVAFGDVVVTSLAGRDQGAGHVTYGEYRMEIEASRSASGGQVSWVLRSLDPETGELPADPFAGFLPPEDGTGRGQGHVTFSVRVRPQAVPGTTISNRASIVFDTNFALTTNVWTSSVFVADPDIFGDGFESGDTSAWSLAIP